MMRHINISLKKTISGTMNEACKTKTKMQEMWSKSIHNIPRLSHNKKV
jgi:hypothetical protein